MFRLKFLLTSATILFPFFIFSQPLNSSNDFSQVDSIARSVKYKKDIYRLTRDLTNGYSEQLLKVRAIFIWVTDNIRYDYKFYNTGKEIKGPKCKPKMNCEQVRIDWENKYINKVLSKRMGICDGYARLFKKMCDISGIRSEIISGYTKIKPYQVGSAGSVNHAWNAVWIDSTYHLLDATWAAGFCFEDEESSKLLSFEKSFDNYYWFTPFPDFTRNHYPQNGKWVFEANYTKEKFAGSPYYAREVISKIKMLSPAPGIVNTKKGDTLHFKFDYTGHIRFLQVNSNNFRNPDIWKWENISKRRKAWKEDTLALKKQQYVSFKHYENTYEFDYIVTDNSLYFLDILFDYQRAMRFKVSIDKKEL